MASSKLGAPAESFRPTLVGRDYAVSCGHYLAALAAARVLDQGGNAVDAGVTAAMALAVLQPDIVSFAGVAPTLVYTAADRKVTSLAGLGYWPAATDVARLREEGGEAIPEGLLRTVMPAAPATHIEALRRFGTISFAQAARPAAELASAGFGMYAKLANSIAADAASFARWPSSAAVFLPGGRTPKAGELFRQPDLGRTIGAMIAASERTSDREAGLAAAADHFYRGPVARAIAEYHREHRGFVTADDLAGFRVPVEEAVSARYGAYEVHANPAWCQGLTLLEALATLDGMHVGGMAHNSPAYLHLVVEALDLAFADREAYLGDPAFVNVPVEGLLSPEYARRQRGRIDAGHAFGEMPRPGSPRGSEGWSLAHVERLRRTPAKLAVAAPDTIYCSVIDRHGNVYSGTLSDYQHDTPIIPGTGLAVSSRGSQSRLDPSHPSVVAPLKRPRLTPAPALVTRGGEPFMALGTPGGDVQMQAMLQVFMNVVEFGMPLQRAIEMPRVWSMNFPNSFAPHDYIPGALCVEGGIPQASIDGLAALGHRIQPWDRFPAAGGGICSVMRDAATGLVHAGADPRRECYAIAW
ncbi:MAG TPA: gamma-glutamyltransferase [Usitatibacter sp.]|nr:gamma-glutamyltransferase [Usitatibacter sp.]